MDFDAILLPGIAIATPLAALQVARVHGRAARGWFVKNLVLAGLAVAFMVTAWPHGGLACMGLWLVFLGTPTLAIRGVSRAWSLLDYDRALILARVATALHPFDGTRYWAALVQADRDADRGDLPGAVARLRSVELAGGATAVTARVRRLQLEANWAEIDASLQRLDPRERDRSAAGLLAWTQAAGESGATEAMLERYAHAMSIPGIYRLQLNVRRLQLVVASLAGRVETAHILLATETMSDDLKSLWRSTAHAAAGRMDIVRDDLRRLADSSSAHVRLFAERRLSHPPAPVDPETLSEPARATLAALESAVAESDRVGHLLAPARRRTPGTYALLGLLILAFAYQASAGSTTDARALHDMGALLTPISDPRFEAWRILSAGWLHVGWQHLCANLLGVWLVGRFVEAAWSTSRLLLVYLVGGWLGLGFATLALSAVEAPRLIAGASGAVMALLGATAWILAAAWKRIPGPEARARFAEVVVVVGLQVAIDLITPQVSLLGHLGGLLGGLTVCAVFRLRRRGRPASRR